ncbi:hypothetical protein FGO68_gene13691 [Halteria grandinella]|uniref:Uncharacterized protein n=1 Tax=Halteria grandinella TaxID=5974 RepID=A0A8J8NCM4_HALGN|nr:hypothetical protein FGO68_gene13691 [Halteria grandinella]
MHKENMQFWFQRIDDFLIQAHLHKKEYRNVKIKIKNIRIKKDLMKELSCPDKCEYPIQRREVKYLFTKLSQFEGKDLEINVHTKDESSFY